MFYKYIGLNYDFGLTKNKEYEVISESEYTIKIIDDNGNERDVLKCNFKKVEDSILENIDVEEEFLKLLELTDNKFYIPTDEHSSGFNEVELFNQDDGTYCVEIEGNCCCDNYLNFEGIKYKFPKFALDRSYAFYDKFETWDRFEKAIKGEINLVLLEI